MKVEELMNVLNRKDFTQSNNLGGTAFINVPKLKEAGSTGDFVGDMLIFEALHNLKNSMPEEYNKLFNAAISDPEVVKLSMPVYERMNPILKSTGKRQPFVDWMAESWFDQILGGYLLGGEDANIGTLKSSEWSKDSKIYGTKLKKELEKFEKIFEKNKPIIMQNITRATPEQEKEFFKKHPYYAEFQPNIVDLMKELKKSPINNEIDGLLN